VLIRQRLSYSLQYDPRAAYALWELMDAVEHDAVASGQRKATSFVDNLELMRTHPLGIERQQVRSRARSDPR
jgi:predicted Zn-dependent protease